MKVLMTSVFVNDPAKAHEFYTGVLGFQSKMFIPEANLAIVVSPEDPNGTHLLLEPNSNPIAKTYQDGLYKTNIPVIVFGVDDINSEYTRLKEAGVVFRGEPVTSDAGIQVNFEDRSGNLITLFQLQ